MNPQIKFSVIIPLYNKRESLHRTIMSVINQTYPFFEIIIVDDGSTDGSAEIVKTIKDDRIKLISQGNAGVSAARNKGIKEAKFDLIAFLDADDLWEPDYLEQMLIFINEHPIAGLYGCAYDEMDRHIVKNVIFYLDNDFHGVIQDYFIHAKKYHVFWTSAVIVKKTAILNVGGFDEQICLGEDIDLWFRIAYMYPVAFNARVLAHYNVGAENRAITKRHLFNRSILHHSSKYAEMEKNNPTFSDFINTYRLRRIPELYSSYFISKNEMIHFFSLINIKGQKNKHKLFMLLPFTLKRYVMLIQKKLIPTIFSKLRFFITHAF